MDASAVQILEHIKVNALGPMRTIQLVLPQMLKNNYGRIVNISSTQGSIGNLLEIQKYRMYPETDYRISKGTLNFVTALFEDYLRPNGIRPSSDGPRPNILINSTCPGWAKTRMGGPNAEISVEESIDTPVWLATLPDDGPTGKYFRERKEIPW